MIRIFAAAALAGGLQVSGITLAAERAVTLAVDGMNCAIDPHIVRSVLLDIPGVQRADVSYAEKSAIVSFDDAKAGIAELTQATRAVGFPSHIVED